MLFRSSPVRQYAACAGLVTVIAGCCAAKCCIWAFIIAGPMQQYAAYAGPAHRNHKPYVATCVMWALVIKGPVQQYAGYARPVHCTCKLCAVICCIWAFVITGSVQQYAGRVQFEGRPCAETCQKKTLFFWKSRSPSQNQHRQPHSYIQAGGMV